MTAVNQRNSEIRSCADNCTIQTNEVASSWVSGSSGAGDLTHLRSSAGVTWALDVSILAIVRFQAGFHGGAGQEMRSSTDGRLMPLVDVNRRDAHSESLGNEPGGRRMSECKNTSFFIVEMMVSSIDLAPT